MSFFAHLRNVFAGRAYHWNTIQEKVVEALDDRIESLPDERQRDTFSIFYAVAADFIAALYGAGHWAGDKALSDLNVKDLSVESLRRLQDVVVAYAAVLVAAEDPIPLRAALFHMVGGDPKSTALEVFDMMRARESGKVDPLPAVLKVFEMIGTKNGLLFALPLSLTLVQLLNAALAVAPDESSAAEDDLPRTKDGKVSLPEIHKYTGRKRWEAFRKAASLVVYGGLDGLPAGEIRNSAREAIGMGLEMTGVLLDHGSVRAEVVLGRSPFSVDRIVLGDVMLVGWRFLALWTFTLQRLSPEYRDELGSVLKHLSGGIGTELLTRMQQFPEPSHAASAEDLLESDAHLNAVLVCWNEVCRVLKHDDGANETNEAAAERMEGDPQFAGFVGLTSRLLIYCLDEEVRNESNGE